jgi:hypothetical protein
MDGLIFLDGEPKQFFGALSQLAALTVSYPSVVEALDDPVTDLDEVDRCIDSGLPAVWLDRAQSYANNLMKASAASRERRG